MANPLKKLVGAGLTFAATAITTRLVTSAWRRAAGHEPPSDPEAEDFTLAEAAAFALISGALLGVARLLAARGTARLSGRRAAGRG